MVVHHLSTVDHACGDEAHQKEDGNHHRDEDDDVGVVGLVHRIVGSAAD